MSEEGRLALYERSAGSLCGLMCGDALGCPVEHMSAATIWAAIGRLERMVEPAMLLCRARL
jgi:ADP-ribosylglycohydrolase